MSKPFIPNELWRIIEPLLPPRPPSRTGRPPIRDRDVLTGILFVLRSGIPWEDLPEELGCGSGMTCLRRLRQWQQSGVWPAIRAAAQAHWPAARRVDWAKAETVRARARAGSDAGAP